MAEKITSGHIGSNLDIIPISGFLHDRYLTFAYYSIQDRALIASDGLKPVQRRILYYMWQHNMKSNKPHTKAQKVAGSVSGELHPHGDCVRGDTKFLLSNGKYKSIEEMYNETLEDPFKTYEIYSFDEEGKLHLGIMSHVRIGQHTKKVYHIKLSNGEQITTTDNHPFRLFDGIYTKAEDLKEGDILSSGYRRYHPVDPLIATIARTQDNKSSFYIFELSKEHLRELDKNEVVHHIHIDEDRQNNSISNLQIMTRGEHATLHKDYEKGLKIGREKMFDEDGELRDAIKEKNSKTARIFTKNQKYFKARKIIRLIREKEEVLNNDSYMENRGFVYNAPTLDSLIKDGYIQEDINELPLDRELLPEHLRFDFEETKIKPNKELDNNSTEYNVKQSPKAQEKRKVLSNLKQLDNNIGSLKNKMSEEELQIHKVIYIDSIEIEYLDQEQPMYDFTVEGYENAMAFFPETDSMISIHNSSVSEAMARLAQPFNMRVPLIDPMGSVGSQTGDEAAAPRYWESRLTKAAELLVSEVDQKAIKMVPNFDGELMEPIMLPVKWPNSLINGTEGIAVGYASKMVSHNPIEVMDAAINVAKNFDTVTDEDIIKIIKGPDLPTGGEIIGTDEIENYIRTGKGTIVVRGRYIINEMSRGRTQVVFHELPYQVSAEKVISEINKAKDNGRFKEISEVKDLSDLKQGLRLSIMIKASANVNNVINDLFRSTSVESKIPINNTVLINNAPKQVSVLELLKDFIVLREDCTVNRANYRSQEIKVEKHRLDGLMKVLLDIDKTIEIIRKSKDDTIAANKLMKVFRIDEEQAKSILSMRLRSLTKSNSHEIEQKIKSLEEEIAHLESILSDKEELKKEVIRDLEETKRVIGDSRRTSIVDKTVDELKEEDKKQRQLHSKLDKDIQIKVIVYKDSSLRINVSDEEIKDEDIKSIIDTTSKSELVGILQEGWLISVPVQGISVGNATESYKECLAFGKQELSEHDYGMLILTNRGNATVIKNGMKPNSLGVRLEDDEEIIYAKWLTKEEHESSTYILLSQEGKVITTKTKSVNGFNAGSGTVRAMNTDSNIVLGSIIYNEEDVLLAFNDKAEYKATELSQFNSQGRGGSGVIMASGKDCEVIKAEIVSRSSLSDIFNVTNRARAWSKLQKGV